MKTEECIFVVNWYKSKTTKIVRVEGCFEYTKRLGQQHWNHATSLNDEDKSRTLCGMPMLGSNYRDMPQWEKTPCEGCLKVASERGLKVEGM